METILKTKNGMLVQGDNIEVMKKLPSNTVDSCISDFPYDLSFMGKKWDNTGNFYKWCEERAVELLRIMKCGGYVCIFGHPKTNHRMKSAFEDVGFKIVDEIDWIYGTGFPKNQDIGKLFDKRDGAEREVVGRDMKAFRPNAESAHKEGQVGSFGLKGDGSGLITKPSSDMAIKFDGWKTAGLKPAHETITVFQKPLEGTYIQNIEKYRCGGMNIDACRIPTSQADKDTINAKASKNPTNNYSDSETRKYGEYAEDKAMPANEIGRFPANVIFDSSMGDVLDGQSGITKSTDAVRHNKHSDYAKEDYRKYGEYGDCDSTGFSDSGGASRFFLKIDADECTPLPEKEIGRFPANVIFDSSMGEVLDSQSGISKSTGGQTNSCFRRNSTIYRTGEDKIEKKDGGLGDTGGASRYFLNIDADDFVPFQYMPKATKKERGEGNIHTTVKPKALIKWLIKLVTPITGKTIDITAGSGTHGVSCEELNRQEGYKLSWVNIEMMNTDEDPYCAIAKKRIQQSMGIFEDVIKNDNEEENEVAS